MKWVYLADSIIPSRAANSIHVMKMCNALANIGYEVTLVAPKYTLIKQEDFVRDIFEFYGVEPNFSIQFISFPNIRGNVFWRAIKSARLAKKIAPEIVYSRDLWGSIFSTRFGLSVAHEFHGTPKKYFWIKGFLVDRFHKSKRLTKSVVISQALKNIFIKEGFEAKNLMVAHDAADENIGPPASLGAGFHVGYVGHLYKGRGVDFILEMAKRLPNVIFHLIGGTEKDIAYFKSKSVGNNVVFHGFLRPADVGAYRMAMDILIAPYQKVVGIWGGARDTSAYMSPLKIFEYMSAGKAIISSDLPVLREVLNENNAILCPPDNLDRWVESINQLAIDSEKRLKLGKACYADYVNKYTWEIRARNIATKLI
ncbi:MAG TPA: glycosyltransferase [Fulvivirga sp.]|nr:glycosyltransferase [Fulvivirga sp.]